MRRTSSTRASSWSEISTAAFHSRTLCGMRSRARSSTRLRAASPASSRAAAIQSLTESGSAATPRARMALALSGACRRAASSQTSSEPGHSSHPRMASSRAAATRPATSSSLAAAIQPGAWRGLVDVTDLSSSRAFLMSEISASDLSVTDLRSVR